MDKPLFSVIIPAHNEEKYIGKCLRAVRSAAKYAAPDSVEIIVVANRCTDRTAEIAKHYGARVLANDDKCIAAIRNTGVRAANGEIIVTVDADSLMTKYSLIEIRELLNSGKYVGGGTNPKFDRMSLGIAASAIYVAVNLLPIMMKNGGYLSGAMFWCYKRDFYTIGGFDETLVSLEDMDFACRLKKHGEKSGRKYGTLKRSYVTTSSRKFDEFGDWYLIKNRRLTKRIFTGKDREAADSFYYDVR
ncbi:Glycosyltransferase like family 2 [Ruminococcus sp. YE71]|uniref:glycosyltransferase n=1 Tax=unclassified Ruminococcus TaxID=2608920 RepID=UPI000890B969|nr:MULTISPECIES: glycosyltransferase [unclassified Ruminococcus]SDA18817.1 Glycosyltransferase like family 2 [Ruminococcus sp. YE78]SFW29275.1 Glycosyltransferase like family 2 [Ruminococcus sp. YE71]